VTSCSNLGGAFRPQGDSYPADGYFFSLRNTRAKDRLIYISL